MKEVKLSKFDNSWYKPGSLFKRALWYVVNMLFISSGNPVSSLKCFLLRLFGAKVGKGVILKPYVSIKYPWNLEIGNNVWIGEGVWIDNLDKVIIGDNVCLSQGAFLLTGNHNYKKETFDLIIDKIRLEDGVWVGAKSTVCPGTLCEKNVVLTVGAVASGKLGKNGIYSGVPANRVKERVIE